ncbi:MAG: ParB/RepB/Spo0J family partition protein [Planctomycetales bacterium]|nr:ParB/RepB/Spo0J family partition protein [Planctomycetales bacterium]
MTKDRRLGRGLAALLGTPLEEDGIVDGVAGARSGAGSPSAARSSTSVPHGSGPQHSSALVRNSSAGISGTSRPSDSSTELTSARTASNAGARSTSTDIPSRTTSGASSDDSGSGLKLHQADDSPRGGVTGSVPLGGRSSSKRIGDSESKSDAPTATVKKRTSDDKASAETRHVQSMELNVSDIDNNPFQPRRRFNEVEIASLAESIREHEQLQPILVRSVGGRYQLISGERRLRATIHAGLTTIRAELREADDRLVAELAIVENLQRKDLDAIEKAMSFRRYIDEHECTQEDLAKRLKIDRSTIANLMRLLELPDQLQTWVQNEKITAGHARTLLPLGDESQQLEFARQIIEESWTVRETERRVAAHLLEEDALNPSAKANRSGPRSGPRKRGTPHLASLEQQLRLSLGTKTEIRQHNNGKGKIVISFSNPEEFERLFGLICPQIAQKAA